MGVLTGIVPMTTEFDLPCTACGDDLTRREATVSGIEKSVQVADCPRCGARHYPQKALLALRSRMRT